MFLSLNSVSIPKYLDKNEINTLLSIQEDLISLKEYVIFLLMYYGALRVSELCNLKKEDIKILDKKVIELKFTIARIIKIELLILNAIMEITLKNI